MSFFSFFLGQKKKSSAVDAKTRLSLILMSDRAGLQEDTPNIDLEALQNELINVLSKYINLNPDDIKVQLNRQDTLEVLEVKVEMPQQR